MKHIILNRKSLCSVETEEEPYSFCQRVGWLPGGCIFHRFRGAGGGEEGAMNFNRMMELHEVAEEGRRSRDLEGKNVARAMQDEMVDGLTNDLIICLTREFGWSRKEACEEIKRYLK